ncbi:major facilitator superfamily domain-containing protein [Cladochytrium replicatum]|nr:major facilitator superfamily domain-containing protein [Cladochytrium replicatum]
MVTQHTTAQEGSGETLLPDTGKIDTESSEIQANVVDGSEQSHDAMKHIEEATALEVDEQGESDLEPPPDGGYGWVVVFASFVTHFVILGIQYSWGVYQSHLLTTSTFPTASQTLLSLVGTLSAGTLFLLGLLSGRLAERFGFRTMLSIGSTLLVISLVLASFATEVWHLLLTQGFLFGVGSSFAYFPAVSLPSQWFLKRRSVATGIAVSGSGIGGFVFSNVVARLVLAVGFRWTVRITALIVLVCMGVVVAIVRARIPPKPHAATNWGMFKDARFAMLFFMGFLATFGYLIPFVYLPSFGAQVIGLTLEQGSLILSITNFGSAAGRIFLGMGADQYVGKINMLTLCMFLSAACMLLWWPFTNSFGSLLAFGFVNTFFSGGFISMFPVVIAELFGVERLPSLMGMLFTSSAIGNFAGAPLAGVIIETKGWIPAILYAGFLTLGSVVFLVAIRFTVNRKIFARV